MFLLSETLPTVLNGRLNELVCPLIDGRRTAADIVDSLRDQVSPAEVYYALATLEQRGFIEETVEGIPRGESAFWAAQGIDPVTARERLASRPVTVVAVGNVDAAAGERALRAAGVHLSSEASVVVAITDDYRHSDLDRLDEDCRARGAALVLVKPVGWLP